MVGGAVVDGGHVTVTAPHFPVILPFIPAATPTIPVSVGINTSANQQGAQHAGVVIQYKNKQVTKWDVTTTDENGNVLGTGEQETSKDLPDTFEYLQVPLWYADNSGIVFAGNYRPPPKPGPKVGGPGFPPPKNTPGEPYKWAWNKGDAQNRGDSRGGKWWGRPSASGRGSRWSASWDPEYGHWDVDDGEGHRFRFNRFGAPLEEGPAHEDYPGPPRVPLPPLRGPVPIMPNPCIVYPQAFCPGQA